MAEPMSRRAAGGSLDQLDMDAAAEEAPVLTLAVAPPPVETPGLAPTATETPAGEPSTAGSAVRAPLGYAIAYVSSPLEARSDVNNNINLLAPLGSARRRLPALLLYARVVNLLVMLALIYIGLGIVDDHVALTNLTSLLVWNVWWPGLVIAVFFAARLWCGICHLRLTADIFDKVGLKRKVPRALKKYGSTIPILTVIGIFIVHSVVVSYAVPDVPSFTAMFLIALMAYAIAIGLVFEKHSFCKYFCPLIGILGNYTRVSPTELRSADTAQCKRCKDKECIKHCQNRLYMGTMDDEQQESCLLCMRCVKHCPHDNIRFSLRPYLRGLWQSPKRTVSGTFAVLVLLGIVIGEVGENWAMVDKELLFVPGVLTRLTGFETILPIASGRGFLIWETIWVFIVQPLLILAVCGAIAYLLVRKRKPLEYVQIYALGLLPLILSLHAAKLIAALDDNGLYVTHALADPYGFATARAITAGTLAPPPALISSPTLFAWLLIAFVAGFGVLGSLYATSRIAKVSFAGERAEGVKTAIPFYVVIAALGIIAVLTIYSWRIAGGG